MSEGICAHLPRDPQARSGAASRRCHLGARAVTRAEGRRLSWRTNPFWTESFFEREHRTCPTIRECGRVTRMIHNHEWWPAVTAEVVGNNVVRGNRHLGEKCKLARRSDPCSGGADLRPILPPIRLLVLDPTRRQAWAHASAHLVSVLGRAPPRSVSKRRILARRPLLLLLDKAQCNMRRNVTHYGPPGR